MPDAVQGLLRDFGRRVLSAGEAEIKAAYRELARKFHPDVSKEAGAEEQFKAVNEAYEVLRERKARRLRPAALAWLSTRRGVPGRRPICRSLRRPRADSIQEGFGGGEGFSDFFESLFGGARAPGRGQRAAPARRCARQAGDPAGVRLRGGTQTISVDGRSCR